jgi:CPA2 family monovalent cation:H+ antiporter-2
MHSLPLITTLVLAFGLALVFGFLAERFGRAPALVGFLLAGIAAGQHTPGPFADPELAHQLSEIGVMLLMFGVGLHFSVRDLLAVKGVALPGALLQMLLIILLGALFAWGFWDWGAGSATLFGLTLSCASTVVVTKALEMAKLTNAPEGRVAMGWLIVQDLVTVIILVLLPPFASVMLSSGPVDGRAIVGNVLSSPLPPTRTACPRCTRAS